MLIAPRIPRRFHIDQDRADPAGLNRGGSIEDADHRRRIIDGTQTVAAIALGGRPTNSYCTTDTTVSSSTFISVTGMAQSVFVPLTSSVDIAGALYVEEVTAGQFSARIVNGATVLWTVTTQEQGCILAVGGQLGQWVISIGGPGLLDATGGSVYALDVEIAAPTGSYKVLTGSGKESNLRTQPWPTVETG